MKKVLTSILIVFSHFCLGQTSIQEVRTTISEVATQSEPDSISPKLIWVEGGSMKLGCTNEQSPYHCFEDEKPAHKVTVSGFHIG